MLVMSKGALTAAQAETYYEEKYSQDDYYSEEQRIVGQWFGRGAEELGLSGEVTTEDFRSVLRGFPLPPPKYSLTRRTATTTDAQVGMRPSTRPNLSASKAWSEAMTA